MTPEPADAVVEGGLGACRADLDAWQAGVVARLGRDAIAVIDVPDLAEEEGPLVPAQLRAAAVLYYASQLEAAGLPRFVERLAERVLEGRLHLGIGPAGARALGDYWRERRFRHGPADRARIYSHLFGAPDGSTDPNSAFAAGMRALADALLRAADPPGPTASARARVAHAALDLGAPLSRRSAGATGYDADRILEHLREAIALLRHPEVRAALGGLSIVTMLRVYGPIVLGREADLAAAVARGLAGAGMLRWIAARAGEIASGQVSLTADDPVLLEAARWRAESV